MQCFRNGAKILAVTFLQVVSKHADSQNQPCNKEALKIFCSITFDAFCSFMRMTILAIFIVRNS